MRSYEVMIILDPEVDDRQVTHMVEAHLKPAVKAGAEVASVDVMGRRRLAYDIKKRSEGTYVVVNLTTEPDVVKELDRRLTIDELVLRSKVFRPEPMTARRAKRAAERAARPERPEKPDRNDRGDRGERGNRSDRGDRGDRSDRGDRGDRSDRGDRPDRGDRGDRTSPDAAKASARPGPKPAGGRPKTGAR